MELTIDEIHTYLHCPMKYHFKHNKELNENIALTTKYKEALHKTMYYFYFSLLNEEMPTLRQMQDKWRSLWSETQEAIKNRDEFLLKERLYNDKIGKANEFQKLNVKGLEIIHNFYHFNKENPGVPIAVNQKFRVPIGGIKVVGNFELIRESIDKSSSSRFIEIVDFKTSGSESRDSFLARNDINTTLASYAFRNTFQTKEDRITYSFLKNGNEEYYRKTERDFKRLEAIIKGVAQGIGGEHFYPRQTFMCQSCPFKSDCDRIIL